MLDTNIVSDKYFSLNFEIYSAADEHPKKIEVTES